jgi:hypothetical protein
LATPLAHVSGSTLRGVITGSDRLPTDGGEISVDTVDIWEGVTVDPAPYSDATTWSAAPGASGNPPSSVPQYMAVISTSSVTKQGSAISGTISHVVIVRVATTTVSPGATLVGEVVAVLS